jgi:type IV secretory pathway VirD2 relaxase
MNWNEDKFEPRLGKSPPDWTSTQTTLSGQLMRRIARAGGNPHRLPSIIPRAPKIQLQSGQFNARGRGAKIINSFPRSSGWTFDPLSGMNVRNRRVFVKFRVLKASATPRACYEHLHYLEREGVQRDGERGQLFSTFADEADRNEFVARSSEDRHQFRLIISPEGGAAYDDLKPFTRDVMARLETDLDTNLDWVAAEHYDTGRPHIHVVVRGAMEDGRILNIAGDYLRHGIGQRASEVLTRDLGLEMEQEAGRRLLHEVEAERLTDLDRDLIDRAQDGLVDLRTSSSSTDLERVQQQNLIARIRRLERMQLAYREEPCRWHLAPNVGEVLQGMGEHSNIVKIIHQAVTEAAVERSPQLYTCHNPDDAPVTGSILACGNAGGERDRRYIVLDGIDGRTHYIDIGAEEAQLSLGSIVRISHHKTGVRRADRKMLEIASAHDGQYNIDIHLRHEAGASFEHAEAYTRRLEAIRSATGAPNIAPDGTWTLGADYLDRVREYERGIALSRPVLIETLSLSSLSYQVDAEGATWLDRQLIGQAKQEHIPFGFGRDVHEALLRRQQWLIDEGLMQRDGDYVTFRKNILDKLVTREVRQEAPRLEALVGKPFARTMPSDRIEGVFRQIVKMTSGRFALIEKSREFTLVPWKPEMQRYLGRRVSGIPNGDSYEWTIGRSRSLSL